MFKTIAILLILGVLLIIAFCSPPPAKAQDIDRRTVEERPSALCDDQTVYECRPCSPAGNLTGGGCWCRFCVSPSIGKTVESAMDLKGIYCKDNRTQLDDFMRQHRAVAGYWQ